jgi:hypothetical protein
VAATTQDAAYKEITYGHQECNAPSPAFHQGFSCWAHLCDQISTLLLVEPKIARQAFLGEPVEEVMARAEWALKHEGEAGFDSERILPAWAQKRGRGYWRTEDRRVEECGYCHGTGWVPGPFKSADEWQEEREGVKCPRCKGSRIALKALILPFNGKRS